MGSGARAHRNAPESPGRGRCIAPSRPAVLVSQLARRLHERSEMHRSTRSRRAFRCYCVLLCLRRHRLAARSPSPPTSKAARPRSSPSIRRRDTSASCPAGDPARGWPCWWYLRVDGLAKGDKLTLEVGRHRRAARRSGQEPRQAAGRRAGASPSGPRGRTMARRGGTPSRAGCATGAMSYAIDCHGESLWLAWGPPFTPRDSARLVRVARRRTAAWAEAFELCQIAATAGRARAAAAAKATGPMSKRPGDLDAGPPARLGIGQQLGLPRRWPSGSPATIRGPGTLREKSRDLHRADHGHRQHGHRQRRQGMRCRRTTTATGPTSRTTPKSPRPRSTCGGWRREAAGPVHRPAQSRAQRQAAVLLLLSRTRR